MLLQMRVPAPTVNCSRAGKGCPTNIFELQNHNGHVPDFNKEKELLNYVHRILTDVKKACDDIDVQLQMIKTGEMQQMTHTLKSYIEAPFKKANIEDDESEDEHIETEAQAQFEQEETDEG